MGGKTDNKKARLKATPKDYTYSEAKSLLRGMGFEEMSKGRTSGSRVMFYRKSDAMKILLHKPHPKDEMDIAAVKALLNKLIELGEIDE